MAITREELYEEVWAEPMIKVAARHGVSGSYLARICTLLNVPRPERGYWAKLAVSKAPPRPPLPEARPGDDVVWVREGEPIRSPRKLPQPPSPGEVIPTPRRSPRRKDHSLVVGGRSHFLDTRKSDNGYLRPSKWRLVDLYVTRETLDRALKLANTLFKTCENHGYRVTLAPKDQRLSRPSLDERLGNSKTNRYFYYHPWSPDRPTVVYVGTVAFSLTIYEPSENVAVRYVNGEYVRASRLGGRHRHSGYGGDSTRDMPTGRLSIRASSPYPRVNWEQHWHEETSGALEGMLSEVIQRLEEQSLPIAEQVAVAERQAEIEHRKWEERMAQLDRERRERQRLENIKEAKEELFEIIESWGVAKRIEAFFEDAEARVVDFDAEDRRLVLEKLTRARELLGGVDALAWFKCWKCPEER